MGVRIPITTDVEDNFKCVREFWQSTGQSGLIPQIMALINAEPMGLLGASTCYGDNEQNYYYIAVSTDKPVPSSMFEENIPEATWAIFTGEGTPGSIGDLQKRIFSEWLPTSGYEWATVADIEVYLNDDPVNMKYEVWLPVVKAK